MLDLDETLLHAVVYNMRDSFDEVYVEGSDFQFTLGKYEYIITLRPNLDGFLKWASEKFELILYTAGSEEYAKQVLKRIDPNDVYFSHKLSRKHCIKNKKTDAFQKDLSILNRPMDRLVLVDNSAHSFAMQPDNGIPISSFYENDEDSALICLQDFLTHLYDHQNDVRPLLKHTFELEEILMQNYSKIYG